MITKAEKAIKVSAPAHSTQFDRNPVYTKNRTPSAQKIGAVKASSFKRLIVDSTVMPKAIAHPTDSRLLERGRQHLVKLADEHGIELRHNYNREAPRMALEIGRYAHAKQFKRMHKTVKTLKTRVGRVYRDVQRNIDVIPEEHRAKANDLLYRVNRILTQQKKDKNKLYALHAPEVEWIAKGKARTPYEFGVKVTVATTLKEGPRGRYAIDAGESLGWPHTGRDR